MRKNQASQWDVLFKEALTIIDHVNRDHELLTSWSFGGGTALMLQIEHRESHDVDLFIDDPQLLPYLSASVAELAFAIGTPHYNSDGTGHLKVAFEKIGEIDFIVTSHITANPSATVPIQGRDVELETISEIIAKKIRYRGANIQPRDVFDIAAASYAGHRTEVKTALSEIEDYRKITSDKLSKLNPDYVNQTISQLIIKPEFRSMAVDSIAMAKELLD